MKYVLVTIRFFEEYWPEVRRCAAMTVELWTALMQLAPVLAAELREEMEK